MPLSTDTLTADQVIALVPPLAEIHMRLDAGPESQTFHVFRDASDHLSSPYGSSLLYLIRRHGISHTGPCRCD